MFCRSNARWKCIRLVDAPGLKIHNEMKAQCSVKYEDQTSQAIVSVSCFIHSESSNIPLITFTTHFYHSNAFLMAFVQQVFVNS